MATPNGGTFRNTLFAPVLSRLQAELVVLQSAVEAKETSYTAGNFSDLMDAFDTVAAALDSAQTLNADGENPNP